MGEKIKSALEQAGEIEFQKAFKAMSEHLARDIRDWSANYGGIWHQPVIHDLSKFKKRTKKSNLPTWF